MDRMRNGGALLASALVIGLAVPVAAQGPELTQVVGGLDSPRGIAIGDDGTLYVAESGAGGEAPCVEHAELVELCFGTSGRITAISDGSATPVVEGLPSGTTEMGEVLGVHDVAIDGDGNLWFVVGGPAAGAAEYREAIPDGAGVGLGQLYRVDAEGNPESVADLAAYESSDNPDAEQPGNEEPDSNIWSLAATPDGVAITDAGGNDLLMVGADGTISTVAVFPVVMQPAPPDPAAEPDPDAEPPMIPMDPVPTGLALGPDGALYVGELTGFPFPVGGASVFRVESGAEPTEYASGFTNIVDAAFGPDGALYVLEIAHASLLAAGPDGPPAGGLWRVPADGSEPELITSDGLPFPGGLAVGDDGTVYVSTCGSCPPGAGSIVSLTP
jgi:hypothetical protein